MEGSTSLTKADLGKSAVSDETTHFDASSGSPSTTNSLAGQEQPVLWQSPNSLPNGFAVHSNDEFNASAAIEYDSQCLNDAANFVQVHDSSEVDNLVADHFVVPDSEDQVVEAISTSSLTDHSFASIEPTACHLVDQNECQNNEIVTSSEQCQSAARDVETEPMDDVVRRRAGLVVERVIAQSMLRSAIKAKEKFDEPSYESVCMSSSTCSPSDDPSPSLPTISAADPNPNAAPHAITNQSISECESGSKSDSDSSLSSANKASNNSNKRKKKNQRKKSNASTSSTTATTSSSSPAVASKAKNDLPSPTVTSTVKPKATEEKKKLQVESPKASPVTSSTKSPATSPQAGSKPPAESEPKCQIVPDQPKAENTVVQSEIVSKEKNKSSNSTGVTSKGVRCDAIEESTTASQTNSPAASSSDNQNSSEQQSSAEDSSCELTNSKQRSESSLASEASTDQSMDDVDSKTKLNGATGKPFVQNGTGESMCKICAKHVYHMEQIKAEKGVFHKACFRCQECNKQLKVDSYSSHEGLFYCKPHFKQLFQPKPVIENDSKPQTGAKQDDDFENINLDLSNIRNRFENGSDKHNDSTDSKKSASSEKPITRSESIHKIMQKYQSRVAGDKEITSSSDEEDNGLTDNKTDEQSEKLDKVSFTGMSALKSQWESGTIKANNKSESGVEEELAELRQKVKTSEPLKQAYERAIQEAKSVENLAIKNDGIVVDSSVKAVSIKEKFEKGTVESEEDRIERLRKEREAEISRFATSETSTKEARNKFKQIEANMGKEQVSNGANGHIEDSISSNELQQRIKNFENLKDTQSANAKEASGDETDAKADDIPKVDTTKKMLDKFKALEASQSNGQANGAPKSPIRITPPRESGKALYESEPAAERDPNIVRSSYKNDEDIQVEPEKAKNLRAKFENWQTEIERESRKSENEDEYVPHIDTTKNLRAMFESIKDEYKPAEKPRPRINRFVDSKAPPGEVCYVCSSRLYPMEKMEFSGIKIHKNCFRCNKCHTPLRLDNFTVTAEKLFCIPHFKQLFMEKGNYDEGFGAIQHKDKWSNKTPPSSAPTNGVEKLNGDESLMIPTSNGNGVHHDDDDHQPDSVEDHASTEGEDEQPYSHEEPEEHDDLELLQRQVGHLEMDEVLDGPIAVDNLA